MSLMIANIEFFHYFYFIKIVFSSTSSAPLASEYPIQYYYEITLSLLYI